MRILLATNHQLTTNEQTYVWETLVTSYLNEFYFYCIANTRTFYYCDRRTKIDHGGCGQNKSGVDKLALLEGSVKNLQHPPDKAIDRKKDNIIKETQILIDHHISHIKLYRFTVVFRPAVHPVGSWSGRVQTLICRTACNNLLKFSVMLHYPIIFVKHFLLELLS